jgi:hypothetical protein
MVTLSRSITIRARVDEVFRFLEDNKKPLPRGRGLKVDVKGIYQPPP